eukprot:m.146233 g.146233  ORF g.146233 m.146233 type:complete len:327 (+) comp11644_c0_seq4:2367-3347(+)
MAAVMALEVSNGHMGPFQKQHPCPEKYPGARRSAVRNPYGPARPSGSTTVDHDPAYAVAFSLGTASKYHGDDKDASSRTPARDVDGGGGGGGLTMGQQSDGGGGGGGGAGMGGLGGVNSHNNVSSGRDGLLTVVVRWLDPHGASPLATNIGVGAACGAMVGALWGLAYLHWWSRPHQPGERNHRVWLDWWLLAARAPDWWFQPDLSDADAIARLQGQTDGTFIVHRDDSKRDPSVQRFRLTVTRDGWQAPPARHVPRGQKPRAKQPSKHSASFWHGTIELVPITVTPHVDGSPGFGGILRRRALRIPTRPRARVSARRPDATESPV